jgi:hypothetical protein
LSFKAQYQQRSKHRDQTDGEDNGLKRGKRQDPFAQNLKEYPLQPEVQRRLRAIAKRKMARVPKSLCLVQFQRWSDHNARAHLRNEVENDRNKDPNITAALLACEYESFLD